MRLASKASASTLALLSALVFLAPPARSVEVITLKSGQAPVNTPDPIVRHFTPGVCCVQLPPFTAADFAAAAGGVPAIVVGAAHPAWSANLNCDLDAPPSLANWIGTQPGAPPMTALYAVPFNVQTHCILSATLDICWMVDDALGSPTNPAGAYMNTFPIASIAGGNFTFPTSQSGIPVGAIIAPGANTLYFYNADIGAAVSGINFSVRITIEECPTPVSPATWSEIKTRFD